MLQCSKSGPLLFDVYYNDFIKIYRKCTLYADDAALVFVGSNLQELVQRVNETLQKVNSWCNSNKLRLNETNTEWMLTTKKVAQAISSMKIGDIDIQIVNQFKYLDLVNDESIKFHKHLELL